MAAVRKVIVTLGFGLVIVALSTIIIIGHWNSHRDSPSPLVSAAGNSIVSLSNVHVYPDKKYENRGIRASAMEINAEFLRILPDPLVINVGAVPNDGTGDPLWVALEKISDNLKRIRQ